MIEDNIYYSIKAISNSSLSNINPEQDGSPQKYKKFIDGDLDQLNSLSLDRGKLLHKWVEDRTSFEVSDIVEPPEMAVAWCKEVLRLCHEFQAINFDDIQLPTEDIIVAAKNNTGVYTSTKKRETILEKFKDFNEYYNFIKNPSDKITLTKQTKEVLVNCYGSLYSHKIAKKYLFDEFSEFNKACMIFNEKAIYFDYLDEKCKALLDKLIIDPVNKECYIIDLKTTAKSTSKYLSTFIKWRTYRQLAFYTTAVKSLMLELGFTDIHEYVIKPVIIAVETTGLYNTQVFQIEKDWIEKGKEEFIALIRRIKFHKKNDIWDLTQEEASDINILWYDDITFQINK